MLSTEKKKYFLQRLFSFLRIRSISSDPKYKSEIIKAVKFLKAELSDIGFSNIGEFYAKRLSFSTNNPVIYAEKLNNSKAPTVLIYGHYDVQPPEPLELWTTPPFDPSLRGGKIFARGATDDKGQLYTHLAALRILSQKYGKAWPFNIKILIEGEEESGGINIEKLISEKPNKFKADICLVSDTGFLSKKLPAIEVGLRGIVYFEMEVTTGKKDLHSGLFGGAAYNPLNIISQILSKLETKFGVIKLRKEPLNARYQSFDIHGIIGGFQGEGSKTVIPNTAKTKFSVRIVPGQDPIKISRLVKNFVTKNTPKGVQINLKILGMGESFLTKGNSKYMRLAKRAVKKVFGRDPVLTRSGGSIPIVSAISKKTGAEVVLMGYGLPDDNLHAPNEKFDLNQFYKGIECNLEFLRELENLNT